MLNPDFRDMLSALLVEQVEFLIVGSYAVAAHATARATEDLDIWVRPNAINSKRLLKAFVRFGAPTTNLTAEEFQAENLVFQMGSPPWRIDILTSIDGVAFDDAWPERTQWIIDGLTLPIISRRHLIVNKRAAPRILPT